MTRSLALLALLVLSSSVDAQHTVISPAEAAALISDAQGDARPIVIDTRGGYKDYFRGHLPQAHHINFDTLRGTDQAVPVQYLPDSITKALLKRAGADKDRLHLVYATGAALPMLVIGYGGQWVIARVRVLASRAHRIQQAMGVLVVAIGLLTLLQYDTVVTVWLSTFYPAIAEVL